MTENTFKYAADMETYRYLKILKDREEKSQPIKKENLKVVDTDIILEYLDDSYIEDLSEKEVNRELFEDVVMSAMSFIGNSEYVYLKSWQISSVKCQKGNDQIPTSFVIEGNAISTSNNPMVILVENIDIEDKYSKPKITIEYPKPTVDNLKSFESFVDYLNK